MLRITKDGKELLVKPPKYPSTEVKEVLGGRWDKAKELWRLPPTSLNALTLVDWYGDDILEDTDEAVAALALDEWGFLPNDELCDVAEGHPHWQTLYPFQQEAVQYMVSNPHNGALLSLEPGLGKAPVTIVAMDTLELTKCLIVAPLTLARNWQAELDRWSELFRSWSRATPAHRDPITEAVIVNHELLFEPHWYDEDGNQVEIERGYFDDDGTSTRATATNFKKWIAEGPTVENTRTGKLEPARKRVVEPRSTYDLDWDIIVIDESILLKNRRAIKVDLLLKLTAFAKQVWLLSGSPTAKFRTDLYPQLKIISPKAFSSYWRFADFFCTVDRNQWGWKIAGDRPDHDPRSYLRDFMFVRSQKEVLPELPDYIYDPIEVDLNPDQRKAFETMLEEWRVDLPDRGPVEADIALAQSTRLAQITSNMVNLETKRSSAKEDLLMTLLARDEIAFPLLIWCWWVPTCESVFDRIFDETDLTVDYVVGKMKSEEKDEALGAYKGGRTDVLVLQMGVGKFGHTLTDTRTVFYHDRHFDSDAYFQSLRRVRRIGLEHRPRLIVPRSERSADPIVELNLSGKLQSIARLGNRDLKELLYSLGAGMVEWSDPLV